MPPADSRYFVFLYFLGRYFSSPTSPLPKRDRPHHYPPPFVHCSSPCPYTAVISAVYHWPIMPFSACLYSSVQSTNNRLVGLLLVQTPPYINLIQDHQ